MTQEAFDAKMDKLTDVLLETIEQLDVMNDQDFSVSLAAYRFIAGIALAEGWTLEDLTEHLEEEDKLAKEIEAEHYKKLN